MNKKLSILVLSAMLLLCGCGKINYPELPENALAFEMFTFTDPEHDDASYGAIEYNGRTYISYGTLNNSFREKNIDRCVGYILQDENSSSVADPENTSRRVYTLTDDPEGNFLLDYDSTTTLMNQPAFFRAIDTSGVEIAVPSYIDSLEYDYWE